MTTTIAALLLDPINGLIPFLDSAIGVEFNQWQIKPYSFGTSDKLSGVRIRDRTSQPLSPGSPLSIVDQSIVVGRMIEFSGVDTSQMLNAGGLAGTIDRTIREWSKCRAIGLRQPVEAISGGISIEKNDLVSTTTPKALWLAIVRSFSLVYVE